jgi:riboflavin synthase
MITFSMTWLPAIKDANWQSQSRPQFASFALKFIVTSMFTGIIETVGQMVGIVESTPGTYRFEVSTPLVSQLQVGDSLANNGVCLTVAAKNSRTVEFDLLAETVMRTNLTDLKIGSLINLERAMPAMGRFDGHIVQGHVDATATVLKIEGAGQDHRIEIALPNTFRPYVVFKGSVALNGISLTVAEVHERSFVVWIIPHTWKGTNLHRIEVGARVNLEFDLIAKYVERMLQVAGSLGSTSES